MNKKLLGTLGLALVVGSNSLYGQEITLPSIVSNQYQGSLDDHAEFEIIQDNNVQINGNQNISGNMSINTNTQMGIDTSIGMQVDKDKTTDTQGNLDKNTSSNIDTNINTNTNIDVNTNINTDINADTNINTDINADTNVNNDINIDTNESLAGVEENLNNKIILTLDSKAAIVDGVEQELTTPPIVVNGTTLLPMRFVADQVIGAEILWDQVTQTVTMTKDDTVVSVTIGSNVAVIDGLEIELQVAPVSKNNTTLVPLRFLSEAFNVKIDYDAINKTITLEKPIKQDNQDIIETPNQAPIASFYFPEDYVAGQVVSAVNDSFDPDGDVIVDQLWSIVGEKTLTNKELSNMFKTPRAGTYTVGLKVQDAKGLWSDWNYQTVTILPNQAPVVTSLVPTKTSFAQGEAITFLPYTYENESWETVKEGKWTYRKVGEAANRATLGKPTHLFTEGDYIITLYLDDAYGNRSVGFETAVHISNEVVDSELNYKFSLGLIGEWIDNFDNMNYLNFKQAEILNKSYTYGTLIMSDSPEEVKGQGILYQDKINGVGRLLIHHINQASSTETQRLAFAVENPTDKVVTVKLTNKAIKGPATDILRVGQLSLNEYLSGTAPSETIVLQPGEKKFFYEKNWAQNTCISAHIDVETDGEAKFIVANLNASHNLESLDSLYYFPADGVHYSGTYDKTGINYTLNLDGKEAERLTIGTANSGEWIVGYDERTNELVENKGNFGASYYITVTAQEDMGVILNNRGGTFQGAVKWNNQVYNMPGRGTFTGTTTKAVVLGTIKKGETVTIEYLLPNGSAAPTLIGFIPKSQW